MEATIFMEKQAACWYSNLLLGNIADTTRAFTTRAFTTNDLKQHNLHDFVHG